MTDFLLELRSEEIPARMQARARQDLAMLFAKELAAAGLAAAETITYATPRRLALIARGLPDATQAVSEEVKGPRASAPPQALEGFLRKTGLARENLVERDGVLFAVTQKPGRATAEVLAAAIPAIVRAFPWPKSMRWGDASASTESLRWVRPLQGIVALFGQEIVPCEVAGIVAGAATVGHRFHHPGVITIGSADDYAEKLRACHVIVDPEERESIIALGATRLAAEAGLDLVRDEGLLAENAGLTEWPVPLLGRFDPEFLSVPPEVIQLTARVNQKYFVCRDETGALANAFICTANIDAADGGAKIVEGNRKVLAARLSDARFFYDTDLKVPLEEQAGKLDRIVFHEKLGTVADKVERVAKLARWLCEEGIVGSGGSNSSSATNSVTPANAGVSNDNAGQEPRGTSAGLSMPRMLKDRPGDDPTRHSFAGVTSAGELADLPDLTTLADLAERAARLCKADLVTGMVGEFPELQGVMGGYYAAAQDEDPRVAAAIRDHYKPVGQGDDVPTEPVTVAVSLADKLDTIAAFFAIGERPTGSKDPFALRRAALAILRILTEGGLRFPLRSVRPELVEGLPFLAAENGASTGSARTEWWGEALDFFADRLKVQQREAGVRHDLIDAVFALGGEDDLVRLLARVRALQAFVTTDDGANLLAGYKRAANILKKEQWTPPAPDEDAETRNHQGVPPTGEEDPLVLVEDEDFAPVVAEWARHRRLNTIPYDPEPAELALVEALDGAEPLARVAVEREEFERAMAALASLRAPIDAFFDQVTVNDADSAKRTFRLGLLDRVRAAVHTVADFSRIEG